jgi:hypothetical protein
MSQKQAHVLAALAYCKMGMNALPLADPAKTKTKHPSIPWKNKSTGGIKGYPYQDYTSEQWTTSDIAAHGDWYRHGVVGVTGIRNDHVLDLDHIKDMIIIDEVLALLGLPPDYAWVVHSGSLVGAQIWIHNDESSEKITKDFYDYSARDESRFDHIELRWGGNCCVLPPSKHPSGNFYQFREGAIPTSPPATVPLPLIMKALDTIGIIRNPDKRTRQAASARNNDIYDSVKARLTVISDNGDESEVECPWASKHTDDRQNAHIWRNDGNPGFSCLHAHCNEQRWPDVLEILGLAKHRIVLGKQLNEEIDDILTALYAANNPPSIFVRGGSLNRVCLDEDGKPHIEAMTEPIMLAHITRSADFFRYSETSDSYTNAHPSAKHASQVLAQGTWKFPPLTGITEVPIVRDDGTILDQPGYDTDTRLSYIPQLGLNMPTIPQSPTKEQVKDAAEYIGGFISDFPYVSNADKANTYGMLITTVTRNSVRHVPMPTITATKQGTGKGLLTDLTAIIATGHAAASLSEVRSEEEWDKRITALLMNGTTFISIDNVEGVLRSATLSHVLTADSYTGRVLGLSKMATVAQRSIWITNGNNIQLGGDLPRRCYPIRMAVQVSDPWARPAESFKYPNLVKSITDARGKIIAALLTMVRGWWIAGKPAPTKKLSRLGTFSEWVDLVGGVLAYAEINGFLENLDEMHQTADVDGNAWALFLETWYAKLGDEAYTTKVLLEKLTKDGDFSDTLPEPLGTLFQKEDKAFAHKMGRALAKKIGTPYGANNLRIERGEPDSKSGKPTSKVAPFAPFAPFDSSLRNNKTETKEDTQNVISTDADERVQRVQRVQNLNGHSANDHAELSEMEKRAKRGRIIAGNPKQPGETTVQYNMRLDGLLQAVRS